MIHLVFFLFALSNPIAFRAEADSRETEAKARSDDYAAVSSYRAALTRLYEIKKRGQKKPQDQANLCMRIIEIYYKMASIQFRLAHTDVKFSHTANPLQTYQATLNSLIKATSEYLALYPRYPDVPRATYLRAKAYQELNRNNDAKLNFKYVIDHYPHHPDFVDSVINLYELSITAKDYASALNVIKKLESHHQENYYPIILNKIAFAYFYLNDIPVALQYIQKGLTLLPIDDSATEGIEHSERGKLLSNGILFYFTGITRKVPGFSIHNSPNFINTLQPGPLKSRLHTYFIKLLRSNGMDDDLEVYKKLIFTSEVKDNNLITNLLDILENENAKRKTKQISETLNYINEIHEKIATSRSYTPPQKLHSALSSMINDYQPRLKALKDAPEGAEIESLLIFAFNLLLKQTNQPEIAIKIRFNYGECMILRNRYQDALTQFRWIVDSGESSDTITPIVEQAKLKSISIMYDYLNTNNRIPKQLKAKPFPEKDPRESKDVSQWIQWLDQYQNHTKDPIIESYLFEASRILYSEGLIRQAIDRLIQFIKRYPKSKHAVAAASLVIDTHVASSKWEETIEFANEFVPYFETSNKEFTARLYDAMIQSQLKIAEELYQKKKYPETIAIVNKFLKTHPNQESKYPDLITLAANSALQMKDKNSAHSFFSRLDLSKSNPEIVGTALLTSASLHEENYDFEKSLAIYRKYLQFRRTIKTSGTDLKDLKAKILIFAWLTGKTKTLEEVLAEPNICEDGQAERCEELRVWTHLTNPNSQNDKKILRMAYTRSRSGRSSIRALWAILALEHPNYFILNENLELLSTLSRNWNKLDSLHQFSLIPRATLSISKTLSWASKTLRTATPIKLDRKAIQRRVSLIELMEGTLQQLIQFPLVRVRVNAAYEWARLYAGFSEDILKLPKPDGLTEKDLKVYTQTVDELRAPFDKKKVDLFKQALDLSSRSAIEKNIYTEILSLQNHMDSRSTSPFESAIQPVVDPSIFNVLEVNSQWTQAVEKTAQEQSWGKVGFLIQEGHSQKILSESQFSFAQGSTLILMGSQAEGLALYEGDLKTREGQSASRAFALLVQGFYGCQNLKKTHELLELLPKLRGNTRDERQALSEAKTWVENELAAAAKPIPKENTEKSHGTN